METQTGDKPPIKLLKKLLEVQAKVTPVEKTGTNKFQNYDYAEEAGFLKMLNPILNEIGVLIIPTITSTDRSEVERTSAAGEKKMYLMTTVHYEMTIVDPDSGESIKVSWVGDGEDTADKGIYKAMTSGLKYFLAKFFRVPTGDDVENEAEPKGNASGPRKPVEKKPEIQSGYRVVEEFDLPGKVDGEFFHFKHFFTKEGKEKWLVENQSTGEISWEKSLFDEAKKKLGQKPQLDEKPF